MTPVDAVRCGDCGTKIWWATDRDRWEDNGTGTWCTGPDGTRLVWEQQHAPAGHMPFRPRKPEGQVCRCISAPVEHIHRLEIVPDGAPLGPN